MKKIVAVLVFALFLAGCSIRPDYSIRSSSQLDIMSLSLSESTYKTYLNGFSGCTLVGSGATTLYHCELLPGYIHSFDVPHLGIQLTYDQHYDSEHALFLQKNPQAFLGSTKDMVYSLKDPQAFIQKISKKSSLSPENLIASFQLPEKCVLASQENKSNPDIVVYDGSASSACHDAGGKYPIYLFSKTHPDYYYFWHDNLDCSTHPCSVFDTPYIQIFLN